MKQPPQTLQTFLRGHSAYLKALHEKVAEQRLSFEADEKRRQDGPIQSTQITEPLEEQIRRWWINLPPIMQQRRFQIVEIAAQCKGRYHKKPALREVASALRSIGWIEFRDWSKKGRNRRFWKCNLLT